MFCVVVCSGSKDSLEGFKHIFLEGFSREFALDRRILSKDYHGVLKTRDVCSGEPLGGSGGLWGAKMEPGWSNMRPRWIKMDHDGRRSNTKEAGREKEEATQKKQEERRKKQHERSKKREGRTNTKEARRKKEEATRKEKNKKSIYIYIQTPDQPLLAAPYYMIYNL